MTPFASEWGTRLVVLDFDGTLTASDTLPLVAPSSAALLPFAAAFSDDYRRLDAEYGGLRTQEEFNRRMRALRSVCAASNERCAREGLFKGMQVSDLLQRTQQVDLAHGLFDLVAALQTYDSIVISVNWSAAFVRATLARANFSPPIIANDLEASNGVCTGSIQGTLFNGLDKAAALPDTPLVAIGDSEDDIPLLLRAKYGILVPGSGRTVCGRIGIKVTPYNHFSVRTHEHGALIAADLCQVAMLLRDLDGRR